jgi:hypothetical protein
MPGFPCRCCRRGLSVMALPDRHHRQSARSRPRGRRLLRRPDRADGAGRHQWPIRPDRADPEIHPPGKLLALLDRRPRGLRRPPRPRHAAAPDDFTFPDKRVLTADGTNRLSAPDSAKPVAGTATIRQGSVRGFERGRHPGNHAAGPGPAPDRDDAKGPYRLQHRLRQVATEELPKV